MQSTQGIQAPASTGGTTIVGLGLEPDSVVSGQGPVESFVDPLQRDDGEALVDRLATLLDGDGHAIAIHPSWFASAARLRLEMADTILDRPRFALHDTALPPLAAGVLASLASALTFRLSPGVLHAALPALEAELRWFAWLGSVRGLNEPAPGLLAHALSWWPGTQFAASSHPEPTVRRLTNRDRGAPVDESDAPGGLVFCAHAADPSWVLEVLAPALELEAAEVAATAHGPDWWGTTRLVEAVAHPTDVDRLARRLADVLSAWTCRWCEELVASQPCPFCGLAEAGAEAPRS